MRVFLFAAVLVLTGCATQPPDSGADRAAIAERSRAFSAAYVRGDIDTMMEIYAADAVVLAPGREPMRGRESFRGFWTLPEGRAVTRHEAVPDSLVVDGDLAYDHGRYLVAGENDGNAWGPVRGTYLIVWTRGADDRWRMAADMWSRLPDE